MIAPGAIAARRAPDAPALRGRLVDATTGRPLAGRTIELRALVDVPILTVHDSTPVPSDALLAELLGRMGGAAPELVDASIVATPPIPVPVLDVPALETDTLGDVAEGEPAPADEPGSSFVEEDVEAELVQTTSSASLGFVRRIVAGSDGAPITVRALGDVTVQAQSIELQLAEGAHPLTVELGARLDPTRLWLPLVAHGQPLPPIAFAPPACWRVLGATETDADGRFEFECPTETARALELDLATTDEEWCANAQLSIAAAHACEEEVEWRVELAPGSVVRGRVLDAGVHAPLAGVTLVVEGASGASETVTTDEGGRFEGALPFPAGRITFSAYDQSEEARIALEPREADLQLAPRSRANVAPVQEVGPHFARGEDVLLLATMGPTWRLRFAQEVHDEDTARSLVHEAHDASDVLARMPGAAPLAGWIGTGNPFAEWTAVRAGDEAALGLLRYPAPAELPRGGAWVEFRTEDEQWVGSVLLRGGGEQTVVLRRSAQLTVHVAFEADAPRANWIVRLMRAPGLGAAGAYAAADVDEDGDAYVSGIDTTAVRAVELLKDGAVVRTVPLRLEPGDELTLEF